MMTTLLRKWPGFASGEGYLSHMCKTGNLRMIVKSPGNRMRKYRAIIGLCFVSCFTQSVAASTPVPATHWDRSSAMAAAQSVNIDRAILEISDISTLSDGETTLSNLRRLETREDWPEPAREAAIYEFTRSLAVLPRDAVAPEVILHLKNYQARTLVPHEDHADSFVPLFNIRAAASGVENGWQRAEYGLEAQTLLATGPAALVDAYTQSVSHMQRSAYLDALQYADMTDVVAVQRTALDQLAETPRLTPLLGVTAVITGDDLAVQQLLINGRGTGLASILKQIDTHRQTSETAGLLVFAIENAPAGNATLAIAAWWPRLRHDTQTRDLLVGLLADPALGTSAALALAQSPNIQTIKILQDTAGEELAGGDSNAARRARMALEISRDGLNGEFRP
jgi:hypothetical protein